MFCVGGLKGIISLNIPKLIFLSETKCTIAEMHGVRRQVGWSNCFSVSCKVVADRKGKRTSRVGGLALL